MICRCASVLLLLLVLPFAVPCGPSFNDAHHGLLRDPLEGSLELFYARLLRPGDEVDALVTASRTAAGLAEEAERAGKWLEARAAWETALAGMGFDTYAVHAWHIRFVRDRLDLLPLVGQTITPADWARYGWAGGSLGYQRDKGSEPVREQLLALVDDANDVLAAAALTTLAWQELRNRRIDEALAHLATAAARSAPGAAKADEISYLTVIAPLFAHLDSDGHVDDPPACVAAIRAWMDRHADSPWRVHAQSWLAGILYRQRGQDAGDANDGLHAAIRIWQELLTAGKNTETFTPAVESLRNAYRKLRPAPPAWVVADPRHAAAFAWHALTDHQSAAERAATLTAVEPTLVHLADGDADPTILLMLARTWFVAGRPTIALPLVRRSLAQRDTPDTRYLAARLSAESGDPAEAERLCAPVTADGGLYDLLVRTGAAWQKQKAWGQALAAYARANSAMDIAILTDGEMPLAELAEQVRSGVALRAQIDDPWAYNDRGRRAGHDFLPELRRRLAIRLVRADRAPDALPFFDDELRGLCAGLISLQNELKTATDAERADRLYALAAFWYDQGRRLVFIDQHWHQWAYWRYGVFADNPPAGFADERARFVSEMEAMTTYWRAYPLFMELADRFPGHPRAPDALYKAALCRYWLTDQTYLKSSAWWRERAKREHFWDQGDALLKRLSTTYPEHPLAKDAKVLKAVGAAVP